MQFLRKLVPTRHAGFPKGRRRLGREGANGIVELNRDEQAHSGL